MFVHGPGDQGSIPGQVIPKTQKMVLDPALPNTQQYPIYQSLRSDRIWHKVNFLKRSLIGLISEFSFS